MTSLNRRLAVLGFALSVAAAVGWLAFGRGQGGSHQPAQRAAGRAPTTAATTSPMRASASTVSSSAVSSPSTPLSPTAKVNYSDPAAVASAYVVATKSLDWHWSTAAGYLPAVKALSTPAHWKTDLAPLAGYDSGATFYDLKAGHVRWAPTVNYAGRIAAAPHDSGHCFVRVVVDILLTGDADHGRPGGATETAFENVQMEKVGGRWLVAGTSTSGG
jgi:hypothetical protein